MQKTITIYKDDEYRAKIERQYDENAFFSSVYVRAMSVLEEIIAEMDRFRAENEKIGKFRIKFQGMGNNIIAFEGERGQGKTSAMQSFAAQLRAESKNNGNVYVVLDSIDPSALESKESILRVVISRLFFLLQEFEGVESNKKSDEREFRKQWQEILELFEKCYMNIDYLKNGRENQSLMDDLDSLAQQGNSAMMKENLFNLIEHFLQLPLNDAKQQNRKAYLVIQIDDADLATKSIFQICEDIRNYLSIPNVIILMAMNYEQLTYAIHQKYLSKHAKILNVLNVLDENNKDKCYDMAVRYLEKMFPSGHKIILPKIDYAITEDYDELWMKYVKKEDDKEEFIFSEDEFKNCHDMQAQLMKVLYNRTGIVFIKKQERMHSFLPHTMRELTHFVKMLNEMTPVAWKKVYEERDAYEVERLKGNLTIIKQYFMNYWCAKHLTAKQKACLMKLVAAHQKKDFEELYEILKAYKKFAGEQKEIINYRVFMHEIVEKELDDEAEFQEAFSIFFTIYLNEWFAIALEKEKEYAAIARYIYSPCHISERYIDNLYKGYPITNFIVDPKLLEDFWEEDDILKNPIKSWIETFCAITFKKNMQEIDSITETIDDDIVWNENVDVLTVDIFRPIITTLSNCKMVREEKKDDWVDSTVDSDTNEKAKDMTEVNNLEYIVSIRNIIANVDVQRVLQQKLDTYFERVPRRRKRQDWRDICQEVYKEIDSWTEEVPYIAMESKISEMCIRNMEDQAIIASVFLSNKDNREKYIKKFNQEKSDMAKGMQEEINFIEKEILSENENKENILTIKNTKKFKEYENTLCEPVNLMDEGLKIKCEDLYNLRKMDETLHSEYTKIIQKLDIMEENITKDEDIVNLKKEIAKFKRVLTNNIIPKPNSNNNTSKQK